MTRYRCSTLLLLTLTVAPLTVAACAGTTSRAARSTTPDDATITTRVKTALLNDPEIRSKIDVDTFNGVVTLTGAVKTAVEGEKAVALARKINGVSDVKSTLKIE
jgi:hyperosmotically inducible protein